MAGHEMKTEHAMPASKDAPFASLKTPVRAVLTPEKRTQMIQIAAYYRAEHRGFTAGSELEDWLAAEREVDVMIAGVPQPAASAANVSGAHAAAERSASAKAPDQKRHLRV